MTILYASFPHIVEQIYDVGDFSVQASFSLTCRFFYAKFDATYGRAVRVHSVKPKALLPGGRPQVDTDTALIVRKSCPWLTFGTRSPSDARNNIGSDTVMEFADVMSVTQLARVVGARPRVATVRFSSARNDLERTNWTPVRARKYVVFAHPDRPQLVNASNFCADRVTNKFVFHCNYRNIYGFSALPSNEFEVVHILPSRTTGCYDYWPTFLCSISQMLFRGVTHTIVNGAPGRRIAQMLRGHEVRCWTCRHTRFAIGCRHDQRLDHAGIADAIDHIRVLSLEEYRAALTAFEWAEEMIEDWAAHLPRYVPGRQ